MLFLFPCKKQGSWKKSGGLQFCDFIGATLGAGADFLLRRYGVLDMGRAVVMQAASAAMIESYCNLENAAGGGIPKTGHGSLPQIQPGIRRFPPVFSGEICRGSGA